MALERWYCAGVPTFRAADGTELAYRVVGDGDPLVCLPGGPMCASGYLGDLGGLSARRRLILLDLRGTGESAVPADPASYRCDRLVADVAALAGHLGLDRLDLLGHSAGANLAVQYAARYPGQVRSLALVTPSGRALGLEANGEMRRAVALARRGEPWFGAAFAAFERVAAGAGTDADWDALSPFMYGRWDAGAQAHAAAVEAQANVDAAQVFASPGAFDPKATRAALTAFGAPVLVLAGEVDLQWPPAVLGLYAGLFPDGQLVVQPGAGHYPWLDDARQFRGTVAAFLDEGPGR